MASFGKIRPPPSAILENQFYNQNHASRLDFTWTTFFDVLAGNYKKSQIFVIPHLVGQIQGVPKKTLR